MSAGWLDNEQDLVWARATRRELGCAGALLLCLALELVVALTVLWVVS